MADLDDTRDRLREAVDGGIDTRSRLDELQGGARVDARNIVRFLRGIPADDETKKEELRKFFETDDGQFYGRRERKQLYDELLGRERNEETIG